MSEAKSIEKVAADIVEYVLKCVEAGGTMAGPLGKRKLDLSSVITHKGDGKVEVKPLQMKMNESVRDLIWSLLEGDKLSRDTDLITICAETIRDISHVVGNNSEGGVMLQQRECLALLEMLKDPVLARVALKAYQSA